MKDLKFDTNKFIKSYGEDLLFRKAISLMSGLFSYAEKNKLLTDEDEIGEIFFSSNISKFYTEILEDGEKMAVRFSEDSNINIDLEVLLASNGFEFYKKYEDFKEDLQKEFEKDEIKIYG